MVQKLNEMALGYSAAIISVIGMIILGFLGNLGFYTGAVNMMSQWHIFFSLSPIGILIGTIEAAIISFIFGYIFGRIYNKLAWSIIKFIKYKP